MVVDPTLFGLFLVAVVIICVTPGPDMAYVLAQSLSHSALAGVVASLGMSIGMAVHTTAATLGLATVLRASPVAYDVIRYGGAGYLAYLGVRAWLAAGAGHEVDKGAAAPLGTVLWRAAVTNLLNPKIVLFYVAFLPQFVDPGRGSGTLQFLLLGVVFVVIGLLIDSAIALLGGQVGGLLRHRGAETVLSRIAGTVFIGLAIRLLIPQG
jgi:threonine/homoserine/homoserine lactone efflux protein